MKQMLLTVLVSFLALYASAQTQVQVKNLRHYETICPLINVYSVANNEEANQLATTFFEGIQNTVLEAGLAFLKTQQNRATKTYCRSGRWD